VVSGSDECLSAVDVGQQPTSLEYVAVRVTPSTSSAIIAVLYRPGSADVTANFFAEFTDFLDRLLTFSDPVMLTGDVNIHVERASDPDTVEFVDVLAAHGLVQLVSEATHDAGGTLDVVCVRGDLPLPAVDVVDVGLSDHRLLRWTSLLHRPPPLYTTAVRRRWTLFDVDVFNRHRYATSGRALIWTGMH